MAGVMGSSPFCKSVDMVDMCTQLMGDGRGELCSLCQSNVFFLHAWVCLKATADTCKSVNMVDMCTQLMSDGRGELFLFSSSCKDVCK